MIDERIDIRVDIRVDVAVDIDADPISQTDQDAIALVSFTVSPTPAVLTRLP